MIMNTLFQKFLKYPFQTIFTINKNLWPAKLFWLYFQGNLVFITIENEITQSKIDYEINKFSINFENNELLR